MKTLFIKHGYHFDRFELSDEEFPDGRILGEAIDDWLPVEWYDISYAPGVDRRWTIYELAELKQNVPEGGIRMPDFDFVGVVYIHVGKAERRREGFQLRAEAMANCWVVD